MTDSRKLRVYQTRRKGAFSGLSVTYWIIILNVVFFLISLPLFSASTQSCDQDTRNQECYIKYLASNPRIFFEDHYFWTLITSVFMHGSILHLFVNMFVLFSLGRLCERIIGGKRFLWFYLLSGVFASFLFVFLAYFFGGTEIGRAVFGGPDSFAVGASGAIFGVAALFMILTPKLRFSIIFLPFFSLPGYIMIPLALFVMWFVSSSFAFAAGADGGIGNTAHFGGFLAGIAYGLYLKHKYKRKTKMIAQYFSG